MEGIIGKTESIIGSGLFSALNENFKVVAISHNTGKHGGFLQFYEISNSMDRFY